MTRSRLLSIRLVLRVGALRGDELSDRATTAADLDRALKKSGPETTESVLKPANRTADGYLQPQRLEDSATSPSCGETVLSERAGD